MVKKYSPEIEDEYQCEKCGFIYAKEEDAKKCENNKDEIYPINGKENWEVGNILICSLFDNKSEGGSGTYRIAIYQIESSYTKNHYIHPIFKCLTGNIGTLDSEIYALKLDVIDDINDITLVYNTLIDLNLFNENKNR